MKRIDPNPVLPTMNYDGEPPAMRGTADGHIDYLCSGCGVVLLEGMDEGHIRGVAFVCPRCRAHSVVSPDLRSDPPQG
jgi:hypothetical protein